MDIMGLWGVIQGGLSFLKGNATEILAGIGGLYTFLLLVVKLTPTPKDDELLSKVASIALMLAGKLGIKK